MLKHRRILSVMAILTLALACVAGLASCGSSEPQSAKDVITKYKTASPDNCNMKGGIDISMGAMGMNMDMPINFDIDINGKSSHGTFSMSLFGAESKGEMYTIEKDGKFLTYSNSESSGSILGTSAASGETGWTVTEADTSALSNITTFDEGIFDKATFEKTDNGYKITVAGADVYAYAQKIMAESGSGSTSPIPEVPAEYTDFINGLSLNFTFDKDCHLTGISVPSMSTTVTSSGTEVSLTVSGDIAVSNHGKIGEITVPDDVVSSAKAA